MNISPLIFEKQRQEKLCVDAGFGNEETKENTLVSCLNICLGLTPASNQEHGHSFTAPLESLRGEPGE